MAGENEITALKASGANLIRLVAPLAVAGLIFSVFMLWFNDRVLPDANHRLKTLIVDVAAKTPTLELTEQIINPIRTEDFRTRYWLKADRIDDATQRMWNVVIYDLSNSRKARTVYADSGNMRMNEPRTDMMLTLYDGHVHEVDEYAQAELQRVRFAEQRIELRGVGTELRRTQDSYRTDREMTIAMLKQVVDSARNELATVEAEARRLHETNIQAVLDGPAGTLPQTLPPSAGYGDVPISPRDVMRREIVHASDDFAYRASLESQRLANSAQFTRDRMNQFEVEYHKKFAIPFACIIFVLIGAPLAVRFPRGGVGMVIAASFTIFGIYYVSLIGGESLGDRGVIRPFWGPWAPNLLFGILGLFALSRIGRETATSRGGGWGELWASLTDGLRRRRPARDADATPGGEETRP
jgi:lipopolysaccharide export system permease protein